MPKKKENLTSNSLMKPPVLRDIDIENLSKKDIEDIRFQAQCFVGLANMLAFLGLTREKFFRLVEENHPAIRIILMEERNHYAMIRNQYAKAYIKNLMDAKIKIEDQEENSIWRPAKQIFDKVERNFSLFYKDFHENSISRQIDFYNRQFQEIDIRDQKAEKMTDTSDEFRKAIIDGIREEIKKKSKKKGKKDKSKKGYSFDESSLKLIK